MAVESEWASLSVLWFDWCRGTKAAKTDAAAAPQAEAARASTSTPRPTTRSTAAAAGMSLLHLQC